MRDEFLHLATLKYLSFFSPPTCCFFVFPTGRYFPLLPLQILSFLLISLLLLFIYPSNLVSSLSFPFSAFWRGSNRSGNHVYIPTPRIIFIPKPSHKLQYLSCPTPTLPAPHCPTRTHSAPH
uniref:Uncharacterized protein n=1 Tax=Cacopsylla melanoneura TaxID=428564 RepID=A0A8D8ZTP4_9HEMI